VKPEEIDEAEFEIADSIHYFWTMEGDYAARETEMAVFRKLCRLARLGAAVEAMPPGTLLEHERSEVSYNDGPSWRYHTDPTRKGCCNHGNTPFDALAKTT
jgi:hypothetical protein